MGVASPIDAGTSRADGDGSEVSLGVPTDFIPGTDGYSGQVLQALSTRVVVNADSLEISVGRPLAFHLIVEVSTLCPEQSTGAGKRFFGNLAADFQHDQLIRKVNESVLGYRHR